MCCCEVFFHPSRARWRPSKAWVVTCCGHHTGVEPRGVSAFVSLFLSVVLAFPLLRSPFGSVQGGCQPALLFRTELARPYTVKASRRGLASARRSQFRLAYIGGSGVHCPHGRVERAVSGTGGPPSKPRARLLTDRALGRRQRRC